MTVRSAVILPHGAPPRRMLIALCASLLVHLLMIGGWGSGAARTTQLVAPLQLRLEPMLEALSQPAMIDIPVAGAAPRPAASSRRTASVTAAAVESPPGGAGAGGLDPRFYLARELDQYPSPLSALALGDGHAPGSAKLWVNIDQTGRVVEVAAMDADLPGELGQLARERVLATPFVPARRDGRPVKSRVLLVLGR